jgi:toxin ParE1/3/4
VSGEQGPWLVQLAAAAQSDYDDILLWTFDHFGERQMRVYSEAIDDALAALRNGPLSAGVRVRDAKLGLFSLHVARNKRKGRDIILFRVKHQQNVIHVVRMLHDSMDIERHLPSEPAG